jgi:hypothetical protein
MSYQGSIVLASFGLVGAGIALLAACSNVFSLGTNSIPSQAVSLAEVSATVTPCGENAAHPNVCCTSGPGQDASCVTYPEAPFTECANWAASYPDPRSCCPLDGGSCSAPPPSLLDAGFGGCTYQCPPPGCGGYTCPGHYVARPQPDGIECCTEDNMVCIGGGAPHPIGYCPACPPGWQRQGEPALCCSIDPSGATECFSQAGPPQLTDVDSGAAQDAAVPTPVFCGGGGCLEQVNGHYYTVNCAGNFCFCIVDTNPPVTAPINPNAFCSTCTSDLFATCGFPLPN